MVTQHGWVLWVGPGGQGPRAARPLQVGDSGQGRGSQGGLGGSGPVQGHMGALSSQRRHRWPVSTGVWLNPSPGPSGHGVDGAYPETLQGPRHS